MAVCEVARYHFNPESGEVGRCEAKWDCPFGSFTESHYPTREAARTAYEAAMSDLLFDFPES